MLGKRHFAVLKSIKTGLEFVKDPLSLLQEKGASRNVIRFNAGLSAFTLVNHPELIRRILVSESHQYGEGKWTIRGRHIMGDCLITREGESHRQRRALLAPAFERNSLAAHVPVLVQRSERMAASWQDGATIDARAEMGRLAIIMAGDALFGTDLEGEAAELLKPLEVLIAAIPRLPIPWPRVIEARRRVELTASRLADSSLAQKLRDAGLSPGAVRDEIIALLIASVDTTPRALAWTWFLLGRHQDAEAAVHAELEDLLAGRRVTADDIPRLKVLRGVLDESLRLYPPVHFIDRRPLLDVDLDGVRIPKGAWILLSPLITQRDRRYFDDPESFKPERWQVSALNQSPQRLSFPFGAGAHSCIGEQLARLEIMITVATLARHWRLRPTPDLPSEPNPQTARLAMALERRQ